MHSKNILSKGKSLSEARKALIMIHGRGASAQDILRIASHLDVNDYALIAPQATNNSWYPYSFLVPPPQNEPGLTSTMKLLGEIVEDINNAGISSENIFFLGFSQGACVVLEFAARNARKWGGVVAFTGGLIGDRIYEGNYKGDFKDTSVFIGTSDPDPHVPLSRVNETAEFLRNMKAAVTVEVYPDMPHTINQDEIDKANQLIFKSR